jgi:hypothetical protein
MQFSPQWQSSPQQHLRLIVDHASMALLILLLLSTPTWNKGIEGIHNGPACAVIMSSWHDCLVVVVLAKRLSTTYGTLLKKHVLATVFLVSVLIIGP